MIPQARRQAAVWYALFWLKTPYHYGTAHGGDDPKGMDCSGFVSEVLQAVGILSHRTRLSAQGIHDELRRRAVDLDEPSSIKVMPSEGVLQFFLNDRRRVYHVNLCLNPYFVIGAIGGRSDTLNDDVAALQNAFVKVRPVDYTIPDEVLYLDPFII